MLDSELSFRPLKAGLVLNLEKEIDTILQELGFRPLKAGLVLNYAWNESEGTSNRKEFPSPKSGVSFKQVFRC